MRANKLQCAVVWLLAGRGNHQVTSKKDVCSKLYRSCPGLVLALEAFVSLLSIPDVEDGLRTEERPHKRNVLANSGRLWSNGPMDNPFQLEHSNDGPLRELTQMVNEIEVRYHRQIQIGEFYGDFYERGCERGCCIPISNCYVMWCNLIILDLFSLRWSL